MQVDCGGHILGPLRKPASALLRFLLLSTDISLQVSMELIRHSTREMTLATYAQTVGDEKRNADEKVASLVLKGEKVA
jgi:integrase